MTMIRFLLVLFGVGFVVAGCSSSPRSTSKAELSEKRIPAGNCKHQDDLDSRGNRCGGRASSVRPGGKDGGDGHFKDSQGRDRIYGPDNDKYDKNSNRNKRKNQRSGSKYSY